MNWKPILLAYGSLFVLGFVDNSRGPIYPELLRDLNLSKQLGSLFFSLPSLFHVILTLFSVYILKRCKLSTFHSLLLLSMAISCFVVAQSESFQGILVSAAFLGVSLGGLAIVQNVLVSQYSSEQYRRQVFSGLHSMYGLASFIAPLYVELWIKRLGGDWKTLFYTLMALPLMVVGANLWVLRTEKWSTKQEPAEIGHVPFRTQFIVAVVAGGYVASELLISTRLVLYASEVGGYSLDGARTLLSLFFLGLLVGRVFFSLVRLNFSNMQLLISMASVSLLLFLLGIFHSSLWLCLLGASMAGFFPTLMDYLSVNYRQLASNIISKALLGVGVALSVLHLVFGWVADRYGLKQALLLGPSLLLISFFFLIFHDRRIKSAENGS